jgi:aminopeptidase N
VVLDAHLGADRSIAEVAGLRLGLLDEQRIGLTRDRGREVIRQPAWTYDDGYAFNAYSRPALTLRTLERLVGKQTMARILRAYVERWRFRHPSSDDFYAVASEVAGRDLRPFFLQTVESPGVVDFSIGDVVRAPGFSQVTVRRDGDLQIPVTVAFTFAGGRVERRVWDGRARFTRFRFDTTDRLERVHVDPDRNVALDVSWLNNGTQETADRRPAAAMTARWLLVVQQGLGWLAF